MNQVQRDDSGKVIQRHHHEPRSTYEDEKEGGWLPGLGKPTIRQHTKVKDKVASELFLPPLRVLSPCIMYM